MFDEVQAVSELQADTPASTVEASGASGVPADPWAVSIAAAEAELVAAVFAENRAHDAAQAAQADLNAASRRRYDAVRSLAELRQRRAAAMAGAL